MYTIKCTNKKSSNILLSLADKVPVVHVQLHLALLVV